MFHIATPSSHFAQPNPIQCARPSMQLQQPSKGPVVNIQLPRSLKRPPYNEVSRDHIAAVAPELTDVPPEYVRKTLVQRTSSMLAGVSTIAPQLPTSMPRSQLKPDLTLYANTKAAAHITLPTHVLAVYSAGKTSSDSTLALIPTHDIVLASHCALLARIPSKRAQPAGNSPGKHALPLLPLGVPVPAAFPTLHVYLYTHDVSNLLRALVPQLPSSFITAVASSSATLESALDSAQQKQFLAMHVYNHAPSTQTLMGQSQHISGLWKNTVALGVNDANLWDAIDLAWDVIFGALNLATQHAL